MNSVKNEISDKAGKQLTGITILVTRPKEQANEFITLLESAGGTVIEFPAIRITDPISWEACDAALTGLENFGVIAFTSSNAARYFIKRLPEDKMKILQSKKIFAVGGTVFLPQRQSRRFRSAFRLTRTRFQC